MKRRTTVFCTFLLLVVTTMLMGCGSSNKADVTGTWYVPLAGVVNEMTLAEDGTGQYSNSELSYIYEDGKLEISVNNMEKTTFFLTKGGGEKATLQQKGEDFAFQDKADADAKAKEQQDAIALKKAEERFCGTWKAYAGVANNQILELKDTDLTFSIEIKSDHTMTATTKGKADGAGIWEIEGGKITIKDNTDEVITGTIDDKGVLTLDFQNQQIKFLLNK